MRRLKAALAISALTAAGVALTPTAAQAYPTDCRSWIKSDRTAAAHCNSGHGYYKAIATCKVNVPGGGEYTVNGNWVPTGADADSIARCGTNASVVKADLGLREP